MHFRPIAFAALSLGFSLSCLCQATPGASDAIQQHLRDAQKHMSQKQPDLAISDFEAVLALDPSNLDGQANLGVLLYFKGDLEKAAPHLRAAVTAQPNLWKIQALLGLAENRLRDVTNARTDLEAALPHLKEEKVQTEVGNALIESYTATGELGKAANAVSVMLESQPTDPGLLLISYRIYSDLASSSLLTLAISAPHSAEMHQAMAHELVRHGDEGAASANYRQAIQLNPKLPGLHFDFGSLLYNSSDEKLRSEAESQFQAALTINPRDEKAQLMLGEIAARRGDLKAAYDADARAVAMQPDDADACAEFAKILMNMDERDKARKLLVHALEIDPTDYTAHYRLSALDRQEGKMDDARRELAEYKKYKDMKDQLRSLFHEMRVQLDQKLADDTDLSK